MIWLKQSTSVVISFGPFVDKTDGVTLETGLAGTGSNQTENTSTGIRISKNGGAFAARHATAGTSTYDAFGNYLVTLDTTDTNTCGVLRMQFADAATFVPVWADFLVVPAMIYDSIIGGTDRLDTNVTHVGDTSQTARDLGASVLLSSGTGTGQLDFTSGVVKANLAQILGTALTETSGQIAAAFKKFFDKATPTGTINSLPDAVAGANNGLPTTNGTTVTQTVTLTAASVQAIWDALSAALTTANSIGKRIVDYLTGDVFADTTAIKAKTDKLPNVGLDTGSVIDDALNSSTTFKTDLTFFSLNSFLTFTSGALEGETAQVTSANVGTGFVVTSGYSAEPSAGDTFDVINK